MQWQQQECLVGQLVSIILNVQYILEMETPPHLVKFVKLWKKYGNNYLVLNENCAGHIWKRMGSDLRNYKRNAKEKLSYEGTVGGGGKFTEEVIDNFQNYHGTPIRDNKNAVLKMKDAIWAIY